MSMYLDMVNTTGGAIAWAFLKPMLMGQILYTPDTPVTRAIMEKVCSHFSSFHHFIKMARLSLHISSNSCELVCIFMTCVYAILRSPDRLCHYCFSHFFFPKLVIIIDRKTELWEGSLIRPIVNSLRACEYCFVLVF